MTAKEWITKNKPERLDKHAPAGVRGCPGSDRNRVPGMDEYNFAEKCLIEVGPYELNSCMICWEKEVPYE